MTSAPSATLRLSIVIAAWNSEALLRGCLDSLKGQAETPDTELIVAANFDGEIRTACEREFANLKFLALSSETTVPRLRSAGIAAARGEIVALAEDHCSFDRNWCATLKKAHELPYSVIGGSVENSARQRALDWAVYFSDYGRYMLPNQPGEAPFLSGNNVSYKRAALEEVQEQYHDGFFETSVHAELLRRGYRLYLAPAAIVYHNKTYAFGDAFAKCYHLARAFAGRRMFRAGTLKRLTYGAGSLLLPLLLPARIVVRTLRKKRRAKELCLALPFLVVLMAGWAFGEFCGYLLGEGLSAAKWR